MSVYDPLYEHLLFSGQSRVPMTFEAIERVLGRSLPPSARKLREWWANNPSGHAQAKAWYSASYRTEDVDVSGGSVVFALDLPAGGGFMDAKQAIYAAAGKAPPTEFESAASPDGRRRHPAFGSLQGTTIVMPGVDLTEPTFLLLGSTDDT